jgi:hypothetical protein
MSPEIIEQVTAAGFDVYMRDPKDTYMFFTDGKNIGYLQDDRLAGLTLSTVHKANRSTGTGFRIAEGLSLYLERGNTFEGFHQLSRLGLRQVDGPEV